MTCENVTLKGDQVTPITAYVAKPSWRWPLPGVVLIHHLPGWSELSSERRVASPITAISRSAPTSMSARAAAATAIPTTVAPRCAADGGIADSQMVGDTAAAVQCMRAQPNLNGKVGLFAPLRSAARLHLCLPKKDVDACIDCGAAAW